MGFGRLVLYLISEFLNPKYFYFGLTNIFQVVDEDRHVSLSFIISDKIDGNAILQVDAKATLVPVRIIKRMFGIKD
jgi:hypothetical protein